MELLKNPFFMLGATMRDDRRRIQGLAEEKSLIADERSVRDATATLTNPRKRLAAEVGWLPGLGPKRVDEALAVLENIRKSASQGNLPALARVNLLADGLVRVVEQLSPNDVVRWIVQLAQSHDDLDDEATFTLLNEERSAAGFPLILYVDHVKAEFKERRRYYCQAMKSALDKLPTAALVEVLTVPVDQATDNGSTRLAYSDRRLSR